MDADLDTPSATALLFDTVRQANAALDSDAQTAGSLAAAAFEICTAFGLELKQQDVIPSDVSAKAAQLDAARVAKDFAVADALREELQRDGWIVETTKDGTVVRQR
jgi:cysteinyl-tRNA synthetase